MKAGKLILAALVIFLAGMAAGSAASSLRRKTLEKPAVETRETMPSPMSYRVEFLRRAQRDLNLSGPQQERIEGYLRESQEKFRALWEPIAPQARVEFEALRDRIRSELTEEQRARFEQFLRDRGRRGEPKERRTGDPSWTNRPDGGPHRPEPPHRDEPKP